MNLLTISIYLGKFGPELELSLFVNIDYCVLMRLHESGQNILQLLLMHGSAVKSKQFYHTL